MPMTQAEVRRLVTYEVAHVAEGARRDALRTVLVEPARDERMSEWFDEPFACWVVAAAPWSDHVVLFCERGYGSDHWGALPAGDQSMGIDSDWFSTLDDAFIAAGLWTGDVARDYVVDWLPARRPFTVDRLDHLALTVADVDAAARFYTHVLGMRETEFGDGRRALEFGGQKINLHRAGAEHAPFAARPTPGSADLCFVTASPAEEVITHLRACGVEIVDGPVPRTGAQGPMLSVYFRDPDGNLLEVSTYTADVPEPAEAAPTGAR